VQSMATPDVRSSLEIRASPEIVLLTVDGAVADAGEDRLRTAGPPVAKVEPTPASDEINKRTLPGISPQSKSSTLATTIGEGEPSQCRIPAR
jgi:hypothetical protein